MSIWFRRFAVSLLPLLVAAATLAAPQDFNLGSYSAPPVANRSSKPLICTVTYLLQDYTSNETYAERMQFSPAPNAVVGQTGRMPCPVMMPPAVSEAALDGCLAHAAKRSDCVFADMSRGFDDDPKLVNTSDNGARCESDQATEIGIACVREGKMEVCNVGCGESAAAAIRAASDRCQVKHRKTCTITGSLPVEVP